MYNVILCTISLLGTKHINHEFEFATTKDLCIIRITHVTQPSNCNCDAPKTHDQHDCLHTYQLSYKCY